MGEQGLPRTEGQGWARTKELKLFSEETSRHLPFPGAEAPVDVATGGDGPSGAGLCLGLGVCLKQPQAFFPKLVHKGEGQPSTDTSTLPDRCFVTSLPPG